MKMPTGVAARSVMGKRDEPELLGVLSQAIRAVADDGAEREQLIGTLLEGAAYTAHGMPSDQHGPVAAAMIRLLADRLDAYGLMSQGQTKSTAPPAG